MLHDLEDWLECEAVPFWGPSFYPLEDTRMAIRPDLLVEVDGGLHIYAYTPRGISFMEGLSGPGTPAGGRVVWHLPTSVPFDPVVYGAASSGLLVVVRKAGTSP